MPNIVLILTDQERDAGGFEPETMARFRQAHLRHHRALAEQGITFAQHRIASSACVPSRVSLFTGTTVHTHGVKQTDGFAKQAGDAFTWLPPRRLPTVGHRFRARGWDTAYVGKWHLSHADIHGPDGRSLPPGEGSASRYREADPLDPYGFSGWIGPEPHGPDPRNAGINRDPGYVAQACAFLRERARQSDGPPFLLVVSLVNPHDIVFWPSWSLMHRERLDLGGIPDIGPALSERSLPETEPEVLRAYRRLYHAAYGPEPLVSWLYRRSPADYRRFYCSLLKKADHHLGSLLETLDQTGLGSRTTVVFSSDHGELLGAHGGLHQKWYNAFEETLRVPLIVRSPELQGRRGDVVRSLTSHLDLAPTLLGLAGLDTSLPDEVASRFEAAPRLPGRDLFADGEGESIYFATEDDVLEGEHREAAVTRAFPWLGSLWQMRYSPLGVPRTAVEAVVSRARSPEGPEVLYKLIRTHRPGAAEHSPDDELSLFDLDHDPSELYDLGRAPALASQRATLAQRLARWRASAGKAQSQPSGA